MNWWYGLPEEQLSQMIAEVGKPLEEMLMRDLVLWMIRREIVKAVATPSFCSDCNCGKAEGCR